MWGILTGICPMYFFKKFLLCFNCVTFAGSLLGKSKVNYFERIIEIIIIHYLFFPEFMNSSNSFLLRENFYTYSVHNFTILSCLFFLFHFFFVLVSQYQNIFYSIILYFLWYFWCPVPLEFYLLHCYICVSINCKCISFYLSNRRILIWGIFV